jgi:D-serine deaminase-like pyridoxal phosphate-dependent protein
LPVPLVTGAGTGTFALETASGVWGELQAGSYLFMDADYAANAHDPAQPAFEHALFIKSQVISVRRPCRVRRGPQEPRHRLGPAAGACPAGQGALSFANGGDEHGILHADGRWPAHLPALPAGRHRLADPRLAINLHAT